MMNVRDKLALRDKILFGLEKSYQNLLADKRRKQEYLVILQDNKIVHIQP
jgi:hypothetical protein